MRYLLDSGIWFMFVREPERLPSTALQTIAAQPRVSLSCVSLREIALKAADGKLDLGTSLSAWLPGALNGIEVLTISPDIAADSVALPAFPNRDPYDQMIVATARAHGLTLVTSDRALKKYPHARVLYFRPKNASNAERGKTGRTRIEI